MQEGTILFCNDNKHKVIVVKNISSQSFVVESTDKQLSFVKLIDSAELFTKGISFGSWIYLLKAK